MENLFRPGKWLVLFCGVFVLLWGVLQYVSNARLKEEAEQVGQNLFTWSWPGDNWESVGNITDASVIQKTDKDAVVAVKGKQTLMFYPDASEMKLVPVKSETGQAAANAKPRLIWQAPGKPEHVETIDCSATLTFYRRSEHNKDYWVLGKVEFPN
jgi:hypothetical protein